MQSTAETHPIAETTSTTEIRFSYDSGRTTMNLSKFLPSDSSAHSISPSDLSQEELDLMTLIPSFWTTLIDRLDIESPAYSKATETYWSLYGGKTLTPIERWTFLTLYISNLPNHSLICNVRKTWKVNTGMMKQSHAYDRI